MLIEPDEIAGPIGMRVARNDNVVANMIVIQSLERSISIRLVTILAVL